MSGYRSFTKGRRIALVGNRARGAGVLSYVQEPIEATQWRRSALREKAACAALSHGSGKLRKVLNRYVTTRFNASQSLREQTLPKYMASKITPRDLGNLRGLAILSQS